MCAVGSGSYTRVGCWEWNADGGNDFCYSECAQEAEGTGPQDCDTSKSRDGTWGAYYCPKAGEHDACDENGKPSDGTIDSCANGNCNPDTSTYKFSKIFTCEQGTCVRAFMADKAVGFKFMWSEIVHLEGGTFGAWADY